MPVGRHLHVGRLQIPVDDARAVRGIERVGDLAGDSQGFVERQCAVRESRREVLAFDKFHHDGPEAVDGFHAVDLRDARVVQGSQRPGFTIEADQALGIAGELRRQQFQRDRTIECRVVREIDLTHPTRTDPRDHVVPAESAARGKGHGRKGLNSISQGRLVSGWQRRGRTGPLVRARPGTCSSLRWLVGEGGWPMSRSGFPPDLR